MASAPNRRFVSDSRCFLRHAPYSFEFASCREISAWRNSSPTRTAACAAPERQFRAPTGQYARMGAVIWLAGRAGHRACAARHEGPGRSRGAGRAVAWLHAGIGDVRFQGPRHLGGGGTVACQRDDHGGRQGPRCCLSYLRDLLGDRSRPHPRGRGHARPPRERQPVPCPEPAGPDHETSRLGL